MDDANGRFGISINHKGTDNLLRENIVRSNKAEEDDGREIGWHGAPISED